MKRLFVLSWLAVCLVAPAVEAPPALGNLGGGVVGPLAPKESFAFFAGQLGDCFQAEPATDLVLFRCPVQGGKLALSGGEGAFTEVRGRLDKRRKRNTYTYVGIWRQPIPRAEGKMLETPAEVELWYDTGAPGVVHGRLTLTEYGTSIGLYATR